MELDVSSLNELIGPNASGKSNILDALRFLSQAVALGDFERPLDVRGGPLHLSWKGEDAWETRLAVEFEGVTGRIRWEVKIRSSYDGPVIEEELELTESPSKPPQRLLHRSHSEAFWYRGGAKSGLKLGPTECALRAAAANEGFDLGASVASSLRTWEFFDPQPDSLRRSSADEGRTLEPTGRNIASRLRHLELNDRVRFLKIVEIVRSIVPDVETIETIESDSAGRVFFRQAEQGLKFPVHQLGASSGTLRILALVTALVGSDDARLIGIEEPELYVHPAATSGVAHVVRAASESKQVFVTTHSIPFLNAIDAPDSVCLVSRDEFGTHIRREPKPDAVRKALTETGFGLGDLYRTQGFGA